MQRNFSIRELKNLIKLEHALLPRLEMPHIARVTLQYITVDIDDNINIISNLISEH